jgi:Ca2+-binding EF-hand superfamily protein
LYIACGYYLDQEKIAELNKFLDEKNAQRIDLPGLLSVLTYLKELELMNEKENEADEYLDAFVALGGGYDREGTISKNTLIGIIKTEFELTIDMEVSKDSSFDKLVLCVGVPQEDRG